MFWRKKINSNEYEFLFKRLLELSAENAALKNKFENLETTVSNLRGQFNRKLGNIKKEENEMEATETINSSVILPI